MEQIETEQWIPLADGVKRRTLAVGDAMMQMVVRFEADTDLPSHAHPHEQLLHVVSGRLRVTVEGAMHDVGDGKSFLIPGGVPHSAHALEPTLVIDTFSPPREDLLARDRQGA